MTTENINDVLLEGEDGFESQIPLSSLLPNPNTGSNSKVEDFMKNKKAKVWKEFEVILSSLEGSVEMQIKEMLEVGSDVVKRMANVMKAKFDKYWGGVEKINPLMVIAVILDPRYKLDYIKYVLESLYPIDVALTMEVKIKDILQRLFDEYSLHTPFVEASKTSESSSTFGSTQNDTLFKSGVDRWRSQAGKRMRMSKSEIDLYLDEDVIVENVNVEFDILQWWKANSCKFKVLSLIARDVLAIPVSTVASESVFSTGGRVINDFRSSLHWKTAEALICLPNWLSNTTPTIQSTSILEDFLESMEISESSSSSSSNPTSIDVNE